MEESSDLSQTQLNKKMTKYLLFKTLSLFWEDRNTSADKYFLHNIQIKQLLFRNIFYNISADNISKFTYTFPKRNLHFSEINVHFSQIGDDFIDFIVPK